MDCNENCFECQYEDCILGHLKISKEKHKEYQKRWRTENREKYRAYQNSWRDANKERINEKMRNGRLLSRKCDFCGCELKLRDTSLKYGKRYFCSLNCIADYLLDSVIAKGKIKTIIMPRMESEDKNGKVEEHITD